MPPRNEPPSRIRDENEEPTNRDILGAVERIDVRLARVETMINGSASNFEAGLLAKVHTLTQEQESRKFWVGSAVVAAMGAVAASAWSALKGH